MRKFIFGQNTMRAPFDVDEQESEFRSQKPELERGKYDLLCDLFDLQFCLIKNCSESRNIYPPRKVNSQRLKDALPEVPKRQSR
jgi:hypothetical protein